MSESASAGRTDPSRRDFVKGVGLVSVGFAVGPLISQQTFGQGLPGSLRGHSRIDSWLQVMEDGRVRVLTGKLELGQGIRVVMAQVAGEELNIDPSEIEVHLAETEVTPNEGYTAGSRSVEQSAMAVRHAAASAAAILRRRAAERLGAPAERLTLEAGRVVAGDGRGVGFKELLEGKQIEEEAMPGVAVKAAGERRWVGTAVPRRDIERIARGEANFVQDLKFPGMVHARVVRPPRYGGRLKSWDEAALRSNVEGVVKLVVRGSFVGVVTEDEDQAERAQFYLRDHLEWTHGPKLPVAEDLKGSLGNLARRTEVVADGQVDFSAGSHRAAYFKPYVMHGSMGPSCAVARHDGDRMQVWTHSQGVYPLRESLSALLGMPREKIRVTGVPGSGCYGHNGADDVAADAALLARELPGRHVRLQWSRQDEHAWEPYGSAMLMEVEASLDKEGRIAQWRYEVWSDTHSVRPGGQAANLLAAQYLENPAAPPTGGYFGGAYRNAEPGYRVGTLSIRAHQFTGPLRVSALRSLGAYANVFAIESFMDELAEKAGQDPVAFRLAHLQDARGKAVLKAVREMVTQSALSEAEQGRVGYGYSRYKNSASYCAVAAQISMGSGGKPRVERFWASIDAGETINPDGLRNQTEGGLIQSASWTLLEKVRFDENGIVSRDWDSYPILGYADIPEVEVRVIDRPTEPPLGAGEAAQGPAAAAIANAVYGVTGKRVRDLPIWGNMG